MKQTSRAATHACSYNDWLKDRRARGEKEGGLLFRTSMHDRKKGLKRVDEFKKTGPLGKREVNG